MKQLLALTFLLTSISVSSTGNHPTRSETNCDVFYSDFYYQQMITEEADREWVCKNVPTYLESINDAINMGAKLLADQVKVAIQTPGQYCRYFRALPWQYKVMWMAHLSLYVAKSACIDWTQMPFDPDEYF